MFDDNSEFKLQLGTSKKILDTNIFVNKDIPIYLTNPPYDNKHQLLDCYTINAFLSIFDNKIFILTNSKTKTEVSRCPNICSFNGC